MNILNLSYTIQCGAQKHVSFISRWASTDALFDFRVAGASSTATITAVIFNSSGKPWNKPLSLLAIAFFVAPLFRFDYCVVFHNDHSFSPPTWSNKVDLPLHSSPKNDQDTAYSTIAIPLHPLPPTMGSPLTTSYPLAHRNGRNERFHSLPLQWM